MNNFIKDYIFWYSIFNENNNKNKKGSNNE